MTTTPSDTVSQGLERLLPTYARADVTFVRGEGARLWDADGREYLDFGGGIAVVSLGHCHPAPLAAAREQLDRLWHASNLYRTEPAEALAARLSERFGGAQAFFCNSGAEAIEAALKYARKATGKPGVVALEGSFHGRTLGALSATGQPAKRAAFEPVVPGVRFVPPNDIDALLAAVGDDVGLILLEPILGEGGVVPLDAEFLAAASGAATPPRARRDPGRCRAHRVVLRVRAARRSPRPRHAGQGPRERAADRSARSSPTRLRAASSRATTARPSAETRCPALRPALSSTRSTTSCSRTCASKVACSPALSQRFQAWSRCAGEGSSSAPSSTGRPQTS